MNTKEAKQYIKMCEEVRAIEDKMVWFDHDSDEHNELFNEFMVAEDEVATFAHENEDKIWYDDVQLEFKFNQ